MKPEPDSRGWVRSEYCLWCLRDIDLKGEVIGHPMPERYVAMTSSLPTLCNNEIGTSECC